MKKIAHYSMVTLLSTVILMSSAVSQELAVNTNQKEKTFTPTQGPETSGETCSIYRVNTKVLRSFYLSFGEKPDAVWSKTTKGFVVWFKDQKRSTYVYFRPNGAIDYQLHRYFEGELPKDVRHIVRSNFYDYTITHVSEVKKDDFVCYFVKIEDKASLKTIRVTGGEYAVVEDLRTR